MKPFADPIKWYFSKSSLPYWCVLVLDSLIVFVSGFISHWLFYRGYETLMHSYKLASVMLIYTVLSWIGMRMFHTYAGILRYSSFVDLVRIVKANVVSLLIAYCVHYGVFLLPDRGFFCEFTEKSPNSY